jgi:hypothetical protein
MVILLVFENTFQIFKDMHGTVREEGIRKG